MPKLYRYGCDPCDFDMPSSWGMNMHAIDSEGKRIRCRHPGELVDVETITGLPFEEAIEQGRTGAMIHCVCPTCLYQKKFDMERDPLLCPYCSAGDMCPAGSLVDECCPRCKRNTFIKIDTGVMS